MAFGCQDVVLVDNSPLALGLRPENGMLVRGCSVDLMEKLMLIGDQP